MNNSDNQNQSRKVLRSAVGMTHSLRSDLWWTIPFHVLLDYTQKLTKSTLAMKLSVSAPITLCGLPQKVIYLVASFRPGSRGLLHSFDQHCSLKFWVSLSKPIKCEFSQEYVNNFKDGSKDISESVQLYYDKYEIFFLHKQ